MAQLDPSVLDAMYGLNRPGMGGMGQPSRGPEYVQTAKRSAMSRISLNTGTFYLAGAGLGGLYGAVDGFRNTKSKITKIRVNGLVNGVEGGVTRFGNALGVLALTYSIVDALGEEFGVNRLLPGEYADELMPVVSATTTGFLYKCTTSPKQAIIAAAIGGSVMGAFQAVQEYLPRDVLRTIKEAAF